MLCVERDLQDQVHPDTSCLTENSERLDRQSQARDRELDELLAAGWGDVPGALIPPDWPTRAAPTPRRRLHSAETKAKMGESHRRRFQAKQPESALQATA